MTWADIPAPGRMCARHGPHAYERCDVVAGLTSTILLDMKRIRIVVVLAILAIGLGVVAAERGASGQEVYTPAQIQQGRLQQPTIWAGRTVLVQGWPLNVGSGAWGVILPPLRTTSCGLRRSVMYASTVSPRQTLVVVPAKGVSVQTPAPRTNDTVLKTVLETVACVPVVGILVPASAVEQSLTLRVRVAPRRRCTAPVSPACPDAILLQVMS
jgi:hypothetical protein